MNCSHSENEFCSSLGAVCDCGERHCDNDTGIPQCSKDKYFVYEKYHGYREMWRNSKDKGVETGGLLLYDETVVVTYSIKNTPINCQLGIFYMCPNRTKGNYGYVYKQGETIVSPEGSTTTLPRTYIKATVHTHPTTREEISIEDGRRGISAYGLQISKEDIDTIHKLGNIFGYILYENDVYQYNVNSKDHNLFCPIIDAF